MKPILKDMNACIPSGTLFAGASLYTGVSYTLRVLGDGERKGVHRFLYKC